MKVAFDVCDMELLHEYVDVWHDLIVPYMGSKGVPPASDEYANAVAYDYVGALSHVVDQCGSTLRRA
jgi:hypothetical protein